MSAMSEARAGEFAGRRRGGLSPFEINTANALKAKGRGVQFIASYLGRSMEDVSAIFASQPEVLATPVKPEPRPTNRAGAMTKDEAFIRLWNSGVPIDVIIDGLSIDRSTVAKMRYRLGLPLRELSSAPSRSK